MWYYLLENEIKKPLGQNPGSIPASEDVTDSDDDEQTVKELKKTVQNLKKRMKGSLKGQTVQISMSLQRKNKELFSQLEELKNKKRINDPEQFEKEVKHIKTEKEEESKNLRSANEVIKKKLEEEQAILERYRKERNHAEKSVKSLKEEVSIIAKERNIAESEKKNAKKEVSSLVDQVQELRETIKEKDEQIDVLKKKVISLKVGLDNTIVKTR